MSRKGENIYHRRDGRWEGRRIVGKKEGGGYHFRYAYGKTYREVKEKLSVIRIVEGYGAAAAEGDRQDILQHAGGKQPAGLPVGIILFIPAGQSADLTGEQAGMLEKYIRTAQGGGGICQPILERAASAIMPGDGFPPYGIRSKSHPI